MPRITIGRGAFVGHLSLGGGPSASSDGSVMFDWSGIGTHNITEEQARELVDALKTAFPSLYEWKQSPYDSVTFPSSVEFIGPSDAELLASSVAVADLLRNWKPLKREVVQRFLAAVGDRNHA